MSILISTGRENGDGGKRRGRGRKKRLRWERPLIISHKKGGREKRKENKSGH